MASPTVVVDTGPIVALLDAGEAHHGWARGQFDTLAPPLLTCEAVLSETSFLLQRVGADPSLPVTLVERGVLRIAHLLDSSAGISRPPGTRARMKRQSRPNLKRCTRKGVRSFDPTSRSGRTRWGERPRRDPNPQCAKAQRVTARRLRSKLDGAWHRT